MVATRSSGEGKGRAGAESEDTGDDTGVAHTDADEETADALAKVIERRGNFVDAAPPVKLPGRLGFRLWRGPFGVPARD